MKNKKLLTVIIVALVLIAGGAFAWNAFSPGQYDKFAECLGQKGAQFYGAFWCPHCAEQKALFGKSVHKLPYTECSTPDGKGQLAVCTQKGVTTYPTWFFADGSKVEGVQALADLAAKTGCTLP
jgi:hypothetical protein